jgi:hypothetical protein
MRRYIPASKRNNSSIKLFKWPTIKRTPKTIILKPLEPENSRFWVSQVSTIVTCNNYLELVKGNEPKPTPADGIVINANLRKLITSWETRQARSREALLNAVPKNILVKIHQLPTANHIWVRLADEYGVLCDLKYSKAETELRAENININEGSYRSVRQIGRSK